MKIQLFRNGTGLIYGGDPKRMSCDSSGALRIGDTEISVAQGEEAVMPYLFHGATGNYSAVFIDTEGRTFALERVLVRSGRLVSPPPTAVEIMELRCRADKAEEELEVLRKRIGELEGIFDTDSLNFLIR